MTAGICLNIIQDDHSDMIVMLILDYEVVIIAQVDEYLPGYLSNQE